MAIETGTVISRSNSNVQVELGRTDACTGCKACLLANNGYMLASARNTVHANVGDVVQIEYEKPGQARAGFILYILPLIMFIPGYLIGSRLGLLISQAAEDFIGFLGGIIGITFTFFAIYVVQQGKNNSKPYFDAVKVLSSNSDLTPSVE